MAALHMDYADNQSIATTCPATHTPRSGPGERIIFEPYSEEMFERSFNWIAEHAIFFEPSSMGSGDYERVVISLAAQ
jgi:hypothetical protein